MEQSLSGKNLVLTTNYSVTSADTDMYSRLRPGALVNFLIQSAIESADQMGYGFGGLKKQQLFWVLSRLTLEVYRPLKWYERITVETWPKDVHKLIYLRDFIVRDAEQEVVARGTSGWLAIDFQSKRPRKLEGVQAEIFTHLREKHGLEQPPEKIAAAPDGEPGEIHPTYFDFDLNRHVTSTRYVDWMFDTFSFDFHKEHYPSRISVNYMKETGPGTRVHLYSTHAAEKEYLFEGTHPDQGNTSFRGRIIF